jgi:hypothetical protein
VLTPRRTVLLLVGFLAFSSGYLVYAQVLGWIDGLPQLPEPMLRRSTGEFHPPARSESPTQRRLADAFGPNAPETDYAYYPNQFTFHNGETDIVLASGPVPNDPNSNRVTLTPFSLAIFGKPKPAYLCQPGEVAEITTIHSDKGILEFNQVIHSPTDMRTAKLVRLEMVSDFDHTFPDPRRGTVHIRNNQRSADESQSLTIRSPGPVIYRDPKAAARRPAAADEPDFWTDAPVEIVDRQNLPRDIGADAPATAVTKSEDAREGTAVAAMIGGDRRPPPTVTAIGMRVYLEPPAPDGKGKPKKSGSGLQGVRRIEFLEQVLVHLWVDNGSSMVGDSPPPDPARPGAADPPAPNALALTPPPAALAAVTGTLGTAAYTARLQNRALLQIETRGPFFYDSEKSLARFDVLPHSDPNLPNDVQVTKVPPHGGTSTLRSQVLELLLNGGATTANRPSNAPAINKVHAWTYTAGRFVTVTSLDEATEAYGQDLVHDRSANRTDLRGAPLYVVRERNVLSAGLNRHGATLVIKPGTGAERKSELTVLGPGQIDMFDTGANASGPTAYWLTSMVQSKELVNGRFQDLYTFTDQAMFEDKKSDFWMKGKVLKLWLEGAPDPKVADGKAAPSPQRGSTSGGPPKPSRLQAIGAVTSHSTDYDIDECSLLNAFFADAKPTAVAAAPPPPPAVGPQQAASDKEPPRARPGAVAGGPLPPPAVAATAPEPPPADPEKPKPPYHIRSKVIDTWVNRVPVPATAPKPGASPVAKGEPEPGTKVKYQLDRARCEDEEQVTVHQDPTDPSKAAGVDILGRVRVIEGNPDGNILTVYGWQHRAGEVHQEDTALIGPEVVLDQLHNSAFVKGRGALTMPSGSDLAGNELARAETIVIQFRDRMDFKGALRSAEFEGKVTARQGASEVACSAMHVKFDRPIYFNQTQKKAPPPAKGPIPPNGAKGGADDKAKVETVFCYPAAGDAAENDSELYVYYKQTEFDPTGKPIKSQRLMAQEIRMFAQAQDPGGGEKYQRVEADGPGVLRIWQLGERDPAGPGSGGSKAPQPGAASPAGGTKRPAAPPAGAAPPGAGKPTPAGTPKANATPKEPGRPGEKSDEGDEEMKLTEIQFGGRMNAVDKNKLFQQATFKDNIRVINLPAEDDTVTVDAHKLPPRSQLLMCSKELIVVTVKKPDQTAAQTMEAYGNAHLRNDQYDGTADKITNDGQLTILTGSSISPARVRNRFNRGNEQAGREIHHNRATGSIKVIESLGGTIGGQK